MVWIGTHPRRATDPFPGCQPVGSSGMGAPLRGPTPAADGGAAPAGRGVSISLILAAGVLEYPDLAGPLGAGVRGKVLAGSLALFVAYLVPDMTSLMRTRPLRRRTERALITSAI